MNVRSLLSLFLFLFGSLAVAGVLSESNARTTFAQTAAAPDNSAIQSQIDAHNKQIADLQKEIAAYQTQLNTLGGQHQTLQTAIKTIDVSRAQTSSQIKVTQNSLDATSLKLQQLSGQISQKEYQIELDKKSLAQSLREMNVTDGKSIVEQMISADTFSDAWAAADTSLAVGDALRANANMLAGVKTQLAGQQADVSNTHQQLATLDTQLSTQQKALDVKKAEKDKLLTQTKNQESSYQSLITQKKAQQKAFENELNSLESQLKSVGQASIPTVGKGILTWPFSPTFANLCLGKAGALGNNFCVTQYFGNTAFAASGAYNGSGHNGIDIGMPIGTPVQAALAGTVLGTGNTDLAHSSSGAMCYSFGKWVAVKHSNGLATVYAHLSQINVSSGQTVTTGQLVGYSGMTGYATGPHLHFGVYASAGIQILTLNQFKGASTPCANASMPVAPLNAYLNPISYL
ncbi:MAG: putative zinc metalloprotease [Parcubacteria group bacterium]|nr:putative zinc metalloprotease [Parcubacteria group bacterium]